ncbi:Sulfur carrier protein adenylyltransferase ThiF [plant metagenome]|uniref:Sulfur carrier protein adenylyltransferase ThiF n=1 Tax=plant metagenome TaxID=1297885 RepID=A0A484THK2_9ZZZZ
MTHLPETINILSPFQLAIKAVEQWLDDEGNAFVSRSSRNNARRKVASWDLDLDHPLLGKARVQLSIVHDFPASTPQIHFPERLCLQFPHIEEDGRFCHGVESSPDDYTDPRGIVIEVLKRLYKYLEDIVNPAWVMAEFQRERLAYWNRFCYLTYKKQGTPTPRNVRAALRSIAEVTEGKIASYHARGPGRASSRRDMELRSTTLLVTVGTADPHTLAVRHGWSKGTLVRGEALWIPIPNDCPWTPIDWPKSLDELEQLVREVTNDGHSATAWLKQKIAQNAQEKSAADYHPKLIILVQDRTCFGYLITPNLIPRLTAPEVVPVEIERVDADWALARDHQTEPLERRRQKRVLLIGCGSIGAPIADLLARAGIGELHLADKENFSIENCARHLLGAEHVGQSKATALADRIRRQTPDIQTKPLRVLATDWISQMCSPGQYDLVIDCTGEGTVRTMLSRFRTSAFGDTGIIHVWIEPHGAAAHTVYVTKDSPWPSDDPWDKVNAASWPPDVRVQLPACSSGFHVYGAADAWQTAGFATERILSCLDGDVSDSTVWSWVRSSAYFDKLNVMAARTSLVPISDSSFESSHITRSLQSVLSHA